MHLTSFCVAVDDLGHAMTYDGSMWGPPTAIDRSGDPAQRLEGISCPQPTFCAAIDDGGNVLTFNGTSWTAPSQVGTACTLVSVCSQRTDVSCASASFCVAIDGVGWAITFDGLTWSTPKAVHGNESLISISCPTVSFCAAIDGRDSAFVYNGTGWSRAAHFDRGHLDPTGVSCASPTFCVAVDILNGSSVYNVHSWSRLTQAAPQFYHRGTLLGKYGLRAVSCTSPTFCLAVTALAGWAAVYNGKHWTIVPSPGLGLDSVSCPTPTFCLAGDLYAANVVTFNPAATLPAVSRSSVRPCAAAGRDWPSRSQREPVRACEPQQPHRRRPPTTKVRT